MTHSSRLQTWAEGVLLTATGKSGTLGWWGVDYSLGQVMLGFEGSLSSPGEIVENSLASRALKSEGEMQRGDRTWHHEWCRVTEAVGLDALSQGKSDA